MSGTREHLLRDHGLRVTGPRVAVLDAVHELGGHQDADAIAGAVRAKLGSVSTQAVYDVLKALTGAGLLRRIEPAGSPARYEVHGHDNHHHLVCRSCGTMWDVDCAHGSAPCMEPVSGPAGFVLDEAEVIYWGQCAPCQAAAAAAPAA